MRRIEIKTDEVILQAELNDSATAKKFFKALPLKTQVNTWGEEIYFEIPVKMNIEKEYAKEIVELGDLGYWPEGQCFCIFFGRTPASRGDEIRPASAVNVIGKVRGNVEALKQVSEGATIRIEANEKIN